MKRRLIPDPTGSVMFNAPNGVVTTIGNQPTESDLDSYAGPGGHQAWMEQFGNGAVTLGLGETPSRNLCGKMKNGR